MRDFIGNYAGLTECAAGQSAQNVSGVWECAAGLAEQTVSIAESIAEDAAEDINLGEGVLLTGNGNVKITLTWDDYSDIDLHCIDPSGYHIFYGDRRSPTGGFLDYDNTQTYGPENIFFSPAPAGSYRVYLHYYASNQNVQSVNYKVVIYQNNSGQVYKGTITTQDRTVERNSRF
jgi:uncharacterized protein YfaP (DUF2135 family)